MEKYYLAIDIGASSGRHMLGTYVSNKLHVEEIYRFDNSVVSIGDELCWDLDYLFSQIIEGLKQCKKIGKIPYSVGIDTWGVDFVLLDNNDCPIGHAVSYRDHRTEGIDTYVYEKISELELYTRTGIQKQQFNTIYQLAAVKRQSPNVLDKASSLLLIPDYFHFKLTGIKKTEYTNATTTQLIDPMTRHWDKKLIATLGLKEMMFQEIIEPGTFLGCLSDEVIDKVGFNCQVIVPATHDTASAIVSVPSNEEDTLYISSGTWSLMGTELMEVDVSLKSKNYNFTNEGGYNQTIRYLKNIMGLWMIQCARKEWGNKHTFSELCALAEASTINSIVDCEDKRFLSPKSMIEEIRLVCKETNQQQPNTVGEVAKVIYESLAESYKKTLHEIEEVTNTHYSTIHIIGGGSNADYLNQLTANKTGRTVLSGPTEATAIGNIAVQLLVDQQSNTLKEVRHCIKESFNVSVFKSKEN